MSAPDTPRPVSPSRPRRAPTRLDARSMDLLEGQTPQRAGSSVAFGDTYVRLVFAVASKRRTSDLAAGARADVVHGRGGCHRSAIDVVRTDHRARARRHRSRAPPGQATSIVINGRAVQLGPPRERDEPPAAGRSAASEPRHRAVPVRAVHAALAIMSSAHLRSVSSGRRPLRSKVRHCNAVDFGRYNG